MSLIRSAGILMYRFQEGVLQVLLGHPGGPYFQYSTFLTIPKGQRNVDEDLLDTALRETAEESGIVVPPGLCKHALAHQVNAHKVVTVWYANFFAEPVSPSPSTFKMEWPKDSGTIVEFPELDTVGWYNMPDAKQLIFPGQRAFLLNLERLLEAENGKEA